VWWRRRRSATLDDVVELLSGLGIILMKIDEKLFLILYEDGEDDEQAR
jgi:hypothetical protein